jgi:hypothetical protein
VVTDGTIALVTSGATYPYPALPISRQLLTYTLSSGAVKSTTAGNGELYDVVISGGYAFIASDDFATLNLGDPNATANIQGDRGWLELSVAVLGTNAFTTISNYGDGRVRIYNITNPAAPVYVRDQGMLGGTTFLRILKLSSNYLVAITPDKPSGVGHDVVVIDATNPNALVKSGDFDIPNFNAWDGVLDGAILYASGGDAGVAIVDLSSPSAPVLKSIINTPGVARGVAISGTDEIAVADGSGGVTFIDVSNKTNPVIKGTQQVPGNTAGVAVTGKQVLAASEQYFNVITRP